MKITIICDNKDISNIERIISEIDPNLVSRILNSFTHDYTINYGSFSIGIAENIIAIDIHPRLFAYASDHLLNIIDAGRLIKQIFLHMLNDSEGLISRTPTVIRDDKIVHNQKQKYKGPLTIRDDGAFNV